MIPCDSLKEKIIIVAEHDEKSMQKIVAVLQGKGFFNIRSANNRDKIYEILKPYHDQSEKIGLIVVNEKLPDCRVESMCQSLASATDGSGIPFVILGNTDENPGRSSPPPYHGKDGFHLAYRISSPFIPQEFLLAVSFLLSLKQERLLRHQQEERLINELAAKSILEAKLKFLVAHDELTGLFNRSSFERQLRLIVNRSNKLQKDGALLFIDIDRFSLFNELEGFEVGDKLLVELAGTVRKLVPADSLFARIGNDEFCLFLENKTKNQAREFAKTIKHTVDNYHFLTGEVFNRSWISVSVSIGIASFDNSIAILHPGEMILHARQACHLAKKNGRDKVWLYHHEDPAVSERRQDIEWVPRVLKALDKNDLFLVFQPIVQLSNGAVSHYEVLLRMSGEDQKIITTERFILAAERMGLIHNIDQWVVEHAIDFLASLPSYMSYVSLAINLSGTAFQHPDLLQIIRDKLELTWVDASRLTFEITEKAAIDNTDKARDMINKIRALGCKFALDDFGAGFCSFKYLKTFSVDYVKIDKQFIRNLLNDETDQILVKSMVDIAGKLGKKTIAEFIETPNTALKLKEIGVDFGQGYAFGRPERHLLENHKVPLAILLSSQSAPAVESFQSEVYVPKNR